MVISEVLELKNLLVVQEPVGMTSLTSRKREVLNYILLMCILPKIKQGVDLIFAEVLIPRLCRVTDLCLKNQKK